MHIIYFKRKGINTPIPYGEESLGNRMLVNLLPAFLFVAQHNGMLLIDEFSSGFHNELEELMVKYFMNTAEKSQMIFVSHSTNLLSTSLLRPDQIYSVEFDGKNGSHIKRFSEEQPRVAQNLDFPVDKAAIYYIFDRDPKSNVDVPLIKKLISQLKNAYKNEDGLRGGLLLLSYPCIESYVVANFIDNTHLIEFAIGEQLKAFVAGKNTEIQYNKITEDTI